VITSTSNPLVKELVRLRTRRHRDTTGRFVIEGQREVALAVAAGVDIRQVVVSTPLGGEAPAIDAPVIEMAEAPFRRASIRQNPDGVLAVASHLDLTLGSPTLGAAPLVLLVEAIEKPGNLGAMLRTADAAGVDLVVVADPATDIHNPNVVRASQGALFTVPVAVVDRGEALRWLDENAIPLVATTPDTPEELWDADLTGPVALAVGAEAIGLSPEVLDASAERVGVPMYGRVDSLNASVTAGIVLYEAVRQRRHS